MTCAVLCRPRLPSARRRLLARLAATLLAAAVPAAHAQAPAAPARPLLLLDFELIDSAATPFPEKQARLAMITSRLREGLAREGLYLPVDRAPVEERIQAVRARENLLDCHGCEREIARAAGADRVLLGWVQRISELILNINFEVRSADTGEVVLAKSVDIRGNNDRSWQRGIDFMLRDMVDKRQGGR